MACGDVSLMECRVIWEFIHQNDVQAVTGMAKTYADMIIESSEKIGTEGVEEMVHFIRREEIAESLLASDTSVFS